MKQSSLCGAAFGFACLVLAPANAQENYPSKPVKLIIPYAAGGLVDTVTRVIAERMSRTMGKPFILEGRPGANGSIATAAVARAEPDGYTLLMITEGHAVNPSIYRNLPYDSVKDFAPIGFIGKSPMLLTVNPRIPARSVAEYIDFAKRPEGMTYGSIGMGSASHLAGEAFRVRYSANIRHVPFRGGAPALTDLVAGQIDSMFITPIIGLQQFRSGTLTPLAIAAPERFPLLPNVPTMAEVGYPLDAAYWFGLVAPAGTPQAIRTKLEGALRDILADPEVLERLTQMGAVVTPKDGKEFEDFIASEISLWSSFIRDNNIKAE